MRFVKKTAPFCGSTVSSRFKTFYEIIVGGGDEISYPGEK